MTTAATTARDPLELAEPVRSEFGHFDTALTPGDITAMLRRRLLLIAGLFVLFAACSVGGFLVWRTYFPGYRAECLIECVSNRPDTELTVEQQYLRKEEYERFVQTQAMLLKSPATLGDSLKVTAVRETQWWKSINERTSRQADQHLIELTKELHAAPVRGTSFLRVSMTCRTRSDPAIIVNELVRQWHDSVRKRSAEEFASQPLEATQGELTELNEKIEGKRTELRAMVQRLPPNALLNPTNNITAQQVRQFGEQVAMLTLELSQLEQYRAIYHDPDQVAVTAEDRAAVEQDPQVAQLAGFLFQLEQMREADQRVYGPNHSVLKQTGAQIEAATEKLASLRSEKLRERRDDIRQATETAYLNTQHALFLAQEKLARAEAALADQDQLLFSYKSLEEELNHDLEFRLQLAGAVRALTRVVRQQSAVKVNVAQRAVDPIERHSPSVLMLPLGLFLSLALSVGIALALELLNTSVRTSQDIVRHVNVNMLGAVPDVDDEETAIKRPETATLDHPRSMVAEAFRQIRTNLQFRAPAERQRTILITSPKPRDGKTATACNLALAVAQSGRRVLLIDANFRRPGLHRVFEKLHGNGLSNVLIGDATLEACITDTGLAGLDVLAAGPVPPNPAELLGSEQCETMLRAAVQRYDQVIIDTAPVLLASDALILGSLVDGVVMVIRAGENSRGIARRACRLMTDVNARLLGAVLNAAQVTRGGYFREQLRTYYDYQTDASVPAASPPINPGRQPGDAR